MALMPFSDKAADYFRTRKIVRITMDTDTSSITLFSRQPIAMAKRKQLIAEFAGAYGDAGYSLKLDATKLFRVDHAVQSYGRFQPIYHHEGRICCGSSVGLGNQRNAGTLTALARKKGDPDRLYGLSCNHVVGGCSTARPGTPITVPGIQDVNETYNSITIIGDHESAAQMGQGLPSVYDASRNRDMAYFEIRDPALVSSMQGSGDDAYDTPTRIGKAKVGMPVKKWGRSTGLTHGEVSLVNQNAEPIDYNVQSFFVCAL